jgi:hypothetical protein
MNVLKFDEEDVIIAMGQKFLLLWKSLAVEMLSDNSDLSDKDELLIDTNAHR